jgi:hypothetical protein
VHDPLSVCLFQSVRDLNPEAQCLFQKQRALGQTIRQRLPFQVLHDHVLGIALAPHVVHRADVRMRELRDRLGLSLEPLAHFRRR